MQNNCVTYRTAWNRAKQGKIITKKDVTGHIIVLTNKEKNKDKIAIYARVSSVENKSNLESQVDRLIQYATAKGYQIIHVVKEIASGINDERPKLLNLFKQQDYGTILVEHKDRLTRFGFNYISVLLDKNIEIVNTTKDSEDNLIQDFVSIITSYCARLYGKRRSKRKTMQLIKELNNDKK